jgi:hypothetical protein
MTNGNGKLTYGRVGRELEAAGFRRVPQDGGVAYIHSNGAVLLFPSRRGNTTLIPFHRMAVRSVLTNFGFEGVVEKLHLCC